jgi:hypothetical protein
MTRKMRQVSPHALTRLLHSGFISEKSEQNDGVAVLEETGGSVPIGEHRVSQNRLQEDP